jgi:uncharacterized membrane protein
MAVLAHALQLIGGWIAPLIIFFVRRQSRFVSFHSLQVLFLELGFVVINMCLMVFLISALALSILRTHGFDSKNIPAAFFAFIPLFWVGVMGMWIIKVVIAVIYSVKAGRGEWAEYPVLGGWARRMLKIGPDGAPLA